MSKQRKCQSDKHNSINCLEAYYTTGLPRAQWCALCQHQFRLIDEEE